MAFHKIVFHDSCSWYSTNFIRSKSGLLQSISSVWARTPQCTGMKRSSIVPLAWPYSYQNCKQPTIEFFFVLSVPLTWTDIMTKFASEGSSPVMQGSSNSTSSCRLSLEGHSTFKRLLGLHLIAPVASPRNNCEPSITSFRENIETRASKVTYSSSANYLSTSLAMSLVTFTLPIFSSTQ